MCLRQRIKLWAKQTLLSKACNVMEKLDKAIGRITTWCGKPWQGRCFGNSEEGHVVSSEGLRDGFLRKVTSHLRPERWPGGSRWKVKARDWAQCIDKPGTWRWSSGCIWGLCPAEQCPLLCPESAWIGTATICLWAFPFAPLPTSNSPRRSWGNSWLHSGCSQV